MQHLIYILQHINMIMNILLHYDYDILYIIIYDNHNINISKNIIS